MLTAGMFVGGRYEIIERIGSGGMADVYKGKDRKLNRYVAIKVLKNEFRRDTTFVTKFKAEAQAAAGLAHPNIVNVYDVGDENGIYYIVMELVEGITLKEYIEKKGRLSAKEAISIAIQVSMGIEAAHNNHIIHRDIKPQNIIISTDGKVKVTDFGIARAASSQTISSSAMGSVHYTSPEQARGGYSDEKSDIYSLGITIYEMVAGRVPFDGETAVVVAVKHLQEEMVSPRYYAPELPHSLEQIIYKCTQKSPDRRYSSMTELIQDLKQALISPEGDFVHVIPVDHNAKTVMFNKDDVNQIKRETGRIRFDEDELEEDYEDYEEEPEDDEGEEEEEEEEGAINPKLEKIMTIGGIVAAVIIAFIVLFLVGKMVGIFSFGSNKDKDDKDNDTKQEAQSDQVEMPNLLGMTEAKAKEELNSLGLGIKVNDHKESDEYKEGEIMEQSVKAGSMVDKHTMILVTICSGEAYVKLIDVTGLSEDSAKKKLEDEGYEVSTTEDYSDTVETGNVITTDPKPDSDVKEGQKVTLIISKGKEIKQVTVPSLKNMARDEAESALKAKGLVMGSTSHAYSADIPSGYVADQDPKEGTAVDEGTSVNLVFSDGPQEVTSTVWKCNAQLKELKNYNGGNIKMVLKQDGVGDKTILEGQKVSFPYVLSTEGATGVGTGTVEVFEWNPDTNAYDLPVGYFPDINFRPVTG